MLSLSGKEVAIIILNWNSYNDSFECLNSLESLNYQNFHVFLVDNNSKDDSFKKLEQDYVDGMFRLDVTFIQTGANLGFAGGNNVGIKEAYKRGYEYFWLLNNDTVVDNNALAPLVESMEKDSRIGIVGSKIYYYGTNKIWFAGGTVNEYFGNTKHIGINEEDSGQYNKKANVDYITGCSLLFRGKVLETVGYMAEDYFLYFEETDWNIKAREYGWEIMYVPESVVFHKVSSSTKTGNETSPLVAYYDIRNGIIMVNRTKNNKFVKRISSSIYGFLKVNMYIIKMLLNNEKNKKYRVKIYYRGLIDGFQLKGGAL